MTPATEKKQDSASHPEAALILRVTAGPFAGQEHRLEGHASFLIGRRPATVQLDLEGDPNVSRTHCLIEHNPPLARVVDLRSKNKTFVNGAPVEEADLRHGDEVRVGLTALRVEFPAGTHTATDWPDSLGTIPGQMPARFPGYDVRRELGRGGMGVVYEAVRQADGHPVALKAVLPAVAPSVQALLRFQREMAILERLTHPHIVQFLATGESGGVLFFVMEFVPGRSVSQAVKEDGPMAPGRVVDLGCQLLEALAHAHLQGFIHRDVKPGNLLLTEEEGREVVKLADFGLGRTYQASMMSGLTISGMPGGTPGFMPPEQVFDFRSARPPADQYAAAATLYYMLTGQMVYETARTMADLLARVASEEPLPLRSPSGGPAIPGGLGPMLCRALQREPGRRWPDVLAFRDALRRAVG
jgi:serine/threonine-protein kinase